MSSPREAEHAKNGKHQIMGNILGGGVNRDNGKENGNYNGIYRDFRVYIWGFRGLSYACFSRFHKDPTCSYLPR